MGGYVIAKSIGNVVTPANLVAIVTNSKIAYDYLQAIQNMPGHPEKVATVALVFSLGGLITKTGDLPTNLGMVSLLIGFVDYMASVGNPGGHPVGDVPGAKRLNLTFKQHMQMQLLLFLLMLFTIGSFIIVIYLTKSLINGNLMKRSRSFVKRSIKKLKKFYPSNKRMVKLIEI